MSVLEADPARNLIDELLVEQQRLSAVERFARRLGGPGLPAHERYYRDLLPVTQPVHGEQFAFAVDLDACTGCKACVSACHSLNGLDEDEIWRNVGMIHGGEGGDSYQQTVTTACHHCLDPACLTGCPVMAYEKDAGTGIVRHLDDQCIGCQYCILKCPYDVPKYSRRKGIVRKCDMCTSRLSAGEAPACVQACPTQAIRIEIVDKERILTASDPGARLVPGAFVSDYTKPTTRYRTRKDIPGGARAADSDQLRMDHAHWPLVWMLLLTQAAAGAFLFAAGMVWFAPAGLGGGAELLITTGFLLLQMGLFVSVLHLGRPLGAWRFFLGLRTSWMSREILVFGMFAAVASASTAAAWWNEVVTQSAPSFNERLWTFIEGSGSAAHGLASADSGVLLFLAPLTALLGLLGVFCSAMIYVDTRRPFWCLELAFTKFFGTTLLLGAAVAACTLGWAGVFTSVDLSLFARSASAAAVVSHTLLLTWEIGNLRRALHDPLCATHRSALITFRPCKPLVAIRVALFFFGITCGLLAMTSASFLSSWFPDSTGIEAAIFSSAALVFIGGSQVIERYLFFTAVDSPRMPGGVGV